MVTRLIVINFVMYTNVKSLCCTPEINTMCINYTFLEKIKFINFIALIFEIYFGFCAEIQNYVVMAFTEAQ